MSESKPNIVFDSIRAMRPTQWTKNAVVLAAFFFAYGDRTQETPLTLSALWIAIVAAGLFSLVSSGIYIINDLIDIENDRAHPRKRYRPIAAGRVGPTHAKLLSLLCLGVGLGGGYVLSPTFAAVLGTYLVMQIAYSTVLKRIALVDAFVIAAGFVLRAMAGAVAITVTISPWLLLCTFLLALFLALCKRRHEKVVTEDTATAQRESMQGYDAQLLDQLIAIVSAATILSYAIYTLWPETVAKFGSHKLGFTVPFVLYGIFRYLELVYRHEKGDRPEKLILSDVPLLVNVALYGLVVTIMLVL